LVLRILLALLLTAAAYLYWDARVPGLPLTAWQIDRYLDPAQPRHRIEAALQQLRSPHPGLARLREHPDARVRAEVARLAPATAQLEDPSPWVRFRAALALERNEPTAARPVLLAALRAAAIFAADSGAVEWRLAEGASLGMGEELGTIDGRPFVCPVPGRLARRYVVVGQPLRPGQRLADVVLADEWQGAALDALGRIGLPVDIDEIRLFQSEKYPNTVQRAAAGAIERIQARRPRVW
jgi:HEAT repeat protein